MFEKQRFYFSFIYLIFFYITVEFNAINNLYKIRCERKKDTSHWNKLHAFEISFTSTFDFVW